MRILMATNTYLPHVGGVARSVETFSNLYRKKGHEVLVLAPTFKGVSANESNVVRIPAIQNFNGSDFSVRLPVPSMLFSKLDEFKPDIIHSHHPFLIGDTALSIAAKWNVPIVFTNHTRYERYTHYVPGDSAQLKRFVVRLVTGYANLCNHVVAPSESIKRLLLRRGVDTPISVIPTGVNLVQFKPADGAQFRRQYNIPEDAFIIGHVGRLAPEKNLEFLSACVSKVMRKNPKMYFLVVGNGPSSVQIQRSCSRAGVSDRLRLVGNLGGEQLVQAYRTMNLFVFASKTETQGMVLAEAMACSLPVVAIKAPGVQEIVEDGVNGILLRRSSRRLFVQALNCFYELNSDKQQEMSFSALETAKEFSSDLCADKALGLYQDLVNRSSVHPSIVGSSWESSLRMIETEWELLSNTARAARVMKLFRGVNPLIRLEQAKQYIRKLFCRAEWSICLLKLDKVRGQEDKTGLVLIQVDGLAFKQINLAINSGRMPFLRRLLRREGYGLFHMYSGIPSTTPAVQGELFYGKKRIVPAFSYVKKSLHRKMQMLSPEAAKLVEAELAYDTEGLLKDGCSYANIYKGGAEEAHFCPAAFGWQDLFKKANPLAALWVILLHGFTVFRVIALLIIELVIACSDCIIGSVRGQNLWQEIKFIPARVAVCILLRELCTAGVIMDIARGMPVISANFLGYDEQAHRRGPESYFAHWSLKGIDQAIKRIWISAKRATLRHYQVWIYSDHGQEGVDSYYEREGMTLKAAVCKLLARELSSHAEDGRYSGRAELARVRWLGGKRIQKLVKAPVVERKDLDAVIEVAAMGPLGHIYLGDEIAVTDKRGFARRLVEEANIPLVFFVDEKDKVRAVYSEGEVELVKNANQVLSEKVPYFKEMTEDVVELCRHPDAGDFVVSGWSNSGNPLSFPLEQGAHGGPGAQETHGFVELPSSFAKEIECKGYLRPGDLRDKALSYLGRKGKKPNASFGKSSAVDLERARVMTYNVHSCIGMDAKVSVNRIAEVISRYRPDFVCLQEIDVQKARTGRVNQAQEIAECLQMEFEFYPSLQVKGEEYGDAILSRFPMRLRRSGELPSVPGKPRLEKRGALWVEVGIGGRTLQLLNTHLGLSKAEHDIQVNALMGNLWLGAALKEKGVVFCGDLNFTPKSFCYKLLTKQLKDAQKIVNGHKPKRTWTSCYPLRRIDYIFTSPELKVKKVQVLNGELISKASDHLPLVIDLDLRTG